MFSLWNLYSNRLGVLAHVACGQAPGARNGHAAKRETARNDEKRRETWQWAATRDTQNEEFIEKHGDSMGFDQEKLWLNGIWATRQRILQYFSNEENSDKLGLNQKIYGFTSKLEIQPNKIMISETLIGCFTTWDVNGFIYIYIQWHVCFLER